MISNIAIPNLFEIKNLLLGLDDETFDSIVSSVQKERQEALPAKEAKESIECPHCHEKRVVRNGNVNGRQRFLCRSCGKTFGATTGTVMHYSKKSIPHWEAYVECFARRDTLRECASRCEISLSSAFNWRHKILEVLSSCNSTLVLSGKVQADEKYFPDNFKGNSSCRNNMRKVKTKVLSPPHYKNLRISGHRHSRGKSSSTRGLSRNKICMPCVVDQNGSSFGKAAGRGIVQKMFWDSAFREKFDGGTVLITDRTDASLAFSKENEIPIFQLESAESRSGRKRNLQRINNFHSRIEKSLKRFVNVGTRYLNEYVCWDSFELKHAGSSSRDKAGIVMKKVSLINDYPTISKLRAKPRLPFAV